MARPVIGVFFWLAPLKVVGSVIFPIAVNVLGLWQIVRVFDKSGRDDPIHTNRLAVKCHLKIAFCGFASRHRSPFISNDSLNTFSAPATELKQSRPNATIIGSGMTSAF
jgi:hypothetical protein